MARRVAELDYRVTGDGAATSRVRTLSTALDAQTRSARAAVPAMAAAQKGGGMMGAMSQTSAAQVMMLTGALGPLGTGLGLIATRAPMAAQGLIAMSAAQERMGLLSRASNAALLGGAGIMAAGVVTAAAYAGSILKGADAYSSMTSRLKIFSDGAVAAAQNEQQLFERAAEARTSVDGLSTLFVRITPAIHDMGRAQSDALDVTEQTSKALAIQGATMAENAAATIQFSQAIASGVLRGDELKSMMESSPLLLRYIAQNLELNGKIGVSFGQMRKLGAEGALTADRLINALLRAKPQIEADFINAPKTAQQGWQVLKDTITRTIGQMAQTSGLQQGVFDFLGGLSKGLDEFRKKALLDPDAFDPVVEAGQLLGDALDRAQDLAGGVVEHFDLIVSAGQALIALKVGETLAVGFSAAATKAREAYTAVQSFRANGVFTAGAALDQTGAAAAINARQAAALAEARATDLKVQAELRARTATAARAAADAASAEVTRLKSAAEVNAAAVSEAEALASAQVTAAERAETAAKSASTAATNAATAASVRSAVAQEAEAAVTAQVTNAQALKAATMRGLNGVYGLLGGSVGVLTIAIGGLIYAVWQEEQAWQKHVETLRDAVVVSDQMENLSRALASATWAEVPALMAKANALRQVAVDAQAAAVAQANAATAYAAKINSPWMQFVGAAVPGVRLQQISAASRASDLRGIVAAGQQDVWKANQASYQQQWTGRARQAQHLQEQLQTGRNDAGTALTSEQRSELTRQVTAFTTAAQAEVRRIAPLSAGADATAASHPGSVAHGEVASALRQSLEAVRQVADLGKDRPAGGGNGGGSSGSGKGRRSGSSMSSEDRATYTLLEKVADGGVINQLMGRTAASSDRFSIKDGKLEDGGKAFTARSEDEARAAAAYLEQMEAITSASETLIDKTGQTRDALKNQAAETLATALATSTATQAEQRWADKIAEANGESRAVVQAERDVAEARRQGVTITDDAVTAYINLVKAQDAARKAQEALNRVKPIVDDVSRDELDRMGPLPQRFRRDNGEMGFDVDAALKQWADAKVRIEAEAERRIRDLHRKTVLDGTKTETQAAEETARDIAAMRVASETNNAEQIKAIWQRLREDDQKAWDDLFQRRLDQERELVDNITGSLKDLVTGANPGDVGKRFMEDLLGAMYDELIGNPLNLAIRTFLRSMVQGDGTGGLWGQVLGALGVPGIGGQPSVGSGASAPSTLLFGPNMPGHAKGGLPGVKALPPGLIRGPGGPREDRIAAWVSNEEFIVNAKATRENFGLLTRLNAGLPGFSRGGLPSGALADMISRDVAMGDYGYGYSPRATAVYYDRDRYRSEASQALSPAGDVNINLVNQTDTPMQATQSRGANGDIELLLRPLVEKTVDGMAATGRIGRSMGRAPSPKRR